MFFQSSCNADTQVEGSNTGEAYLTTEGSEEHQSLASLPQLGSALAAARLESSSKVGTHNTGIGCKIEDFEKARVPSSESLTLIASFAYLRIR